MGSPALELSHVRLHRAVSPSRTNTALSCQSGAGGRDRSRGREKQRPSKMDRDRSKQGKLPSRRREEQSGGVERELEPLM